MRALTRVSTVFPQDPGEQHATAGGLTGTADPELLEDPFTRPMNTPSSLALPGLVSLDTHHSVEVPSSHPTTSSPPLTVLTISSAVGLRSPSFWEPTIAHVPAPAPSSSTWLASNNTLHTTSRTSETIFPSSHSPLPLTSTRSSDLSACRSQDWT